MIIIMNVKACWVILFSILVGVITQLWWNLPYEFSRTCPSSISVWTEQFVFAFFFVLFFVSLNELMKEWQKRRKLHRVAFHLAIWIFGVMVTYFLTATVSDRLYSWLEQKADEKFTIVEQSLQDYHAQHQMYPADQNEAKVYLRNNWPVFSSYQIEYVDDQHRSQSAAMWIFGKKYSIYSDIYKEQVDSSDNRTVIPVCGYAF